MMSGLRIHPAHGRDFLRAAAMALLWFPGVAFAQTQSPPKTVSASVPDWLQPPLRRAGANRVQLIDAWNRTPKEEREGMRFLLENMPDRDLQTLSSAYLREQVSLGYRALADAPWKDAIPSALFLNDVLPYSVLNEERDTSRRMLRETSLPLIADCRTPGEAAQRLNERLFPLLKVRYSTERKRPDQNPTETIESGKATCTGLSILLVDACRSVGIPARVVGTPLWTNLRGNHTWVEFWDGTRWRFTGAAEPDPQGPDRGWFTGDASKALKDNPRHAIYASSFKRTGVAFPLVWAKDIRWVNAENVTDRYTVSVPTTDDGKTRLLVKTVDATGKRVAAQVTLRAFGGTETLAEGRSKGDTADMNDYLTFEVLRVCPPRQYEITVVFGKATVRRTISAGMEPEEMVVIRLGNG
ncbi:MAG: transglutaminase domain-containing protein [Capsulimonadales bacterium]|nr:transglutaminase domain-containing protein [Capsulimonadales bacterium]